MSVAVPALARARLVAVLAVSQVIGWGTTFDMPGVMGRSMAPDVGLSLSASFFGLTLMMLVGGLAGPAIGEAIRRHGAARVLAAGSVVTAAGLGLLALSAEPVVYFLAWVVIGAGGGLALSVPAYAAAVEREGAAARRSIGILMLFTGVSSTIFWPILGWLDGLIGWRLAIAVMAGLHLLVCLPLHLFALAEPTATASPAHEATPANGGPARDGRAAFPLIAVISVVFSFTTFGMAAAFLELMRAAGASADYALWLGSIRPVLGISARAIDLLLDGRGGPVTTALVATGLMAAAFALLAVDGDGGLLMAFVVLYGLGAGLSAVARAVLPLAYFPPADFARQSGRLALPQNIASAVAPVVFVALGDHLGAGIVALSGVALMVLALASSALLAKLGDRAAAAAARNTELT